LTEIWLKREGERSSAFRCAKKETLGKKREKRTVRKEILLRKKPLSPRGEGGRVSLKGGTVAVQEPSSLTAGKGREKKEARREVFRSARAEKGKKRAGKY